MKFIQVGIWAFLALNSSFAAERKTPNVILVTLDGVRWQEFFHGVDPELGAGTVKELGETFPVFWRDLAHRGVVFGDAGKGQAMVVSNDTIVSLPAYQSISAGTRQGCITNSCGRISVETMQERMVRGLSLRPTDIATIGSWEKIAYAAEHIPGATFVNTGLDPLIDGEVDLPLFMLNLEQRKFLPPWGGARYDRYTFAHALRYLGLHHPRFLHIALNDSDEWGHIGDYGKYVETLRQYDVWLKQLVTTLEQMGEYGASTTLLVTTDHGRGNGGGWGSHSFLYPESKYVWFYALQLGKRLRFAWNKKAAPTYTHLDLRPTLEALLGLEPILCKECGQVMEEVLRGS